MPINPDIQGNQGIFGGIRPTVDPATAVEAMFKAHQMALEQNRQKIEANKAVADTFISLAKLNEEKSAHQMEQQKAMAMLQEYYKPEAEARMLEAQRAARKPVVYGMGGQRLPDAQQPRPGEQPVFAPAMPQAVMEHISKIASLDDKNPTGYRSRFNDYLFALKQQAGKSQMGSRVSGTMGQVANTVGMSSDRMSSLLSQREALAAEWNKMNGLPDSGPALQATMLEIPSVKHNFNEITNMGNSFKTKMDGKRSDFMNAIPGVLQNSFNPMMSSGQEPQ